MKDVIAYIMLMGSVATGGDLPFWANANQYGIYPDANGALALACVRQDFDTTKDFHYRWGLSMGARADRYLEGQPWYRAGIVDELYASVGWKFVTLDLGTRHPELDFFGASQSLGSLSTTGGSMTFSGNSRMPAGYTLTLERVAFPWTKGHLVLYGSFGDYYGFDNPYMQDRKYHRTKAGLDLFLDKSKRLALNLRLDHYALWGGHNENVKSTPITFKNYLRIITGRPAGGDGTAMDQANVIGDHGGAIMVGMSYKADGWRLAFQHDAPYSDKSGMKFQNFPDGLNTIAFSLDDKNRWVSDIVYEFMYTMYQSGTYRDHDFHPDMDPSEYRGLTGIDDYFNNYEYVSGWTYYNRSISSPLFLSAGRWFDRKYYGPLGYKGRYMISPRALQTHDAIECNRIIAHHIGLGGKLFRKWPYRLMMTLSKNFGTYMHAYENITLKYLPEHGNTIDYEYDEQTRINERSPQYEQDWGTVKEKGFWQFSAGFSGEIPLSKSGKPGIALTYGFYADLGRVLRDNLGMNLGLRIPLQSQAKR